ncbi:MAG: hypothetical protein AAFU85_02480 [Planctomycetota bacterium]
MDDLEFEYVIAKLLGTEMPFAARIPSRVGCIARDVLSSLRGTREPKGTLEKAWMGVIQKEIKDRYDRGAMASTADNSTLELSE